MNNDRCKCQQVASDSRLHIIQLITIIVSEEMFDALFLTNACFKFHLGNKQLVYQRKREMVTNKIFKNDSCEVYVFFSIYFFQGNSLWEWLSLIKVTWWHSTAIICRGKQKVLHSHSRSSKVLTCKSYVFHL